MKNGLMQRESLETLGFNDENTWKTEKERKREMFRRLIEVQKMADRNLYRMKGIENPDNNIYHV
jgi:hypothetical protein